MQRLWEPVRVGELTLGNRLAMAPMTRNRSTPSGAPTELNARYYAQRASVGLIITEGTQPSDDGQGYLLTPGIYTAEHVAGWRLVTDRVHASGGRLFIQLMHVGRISHPDNTPHGRQPVAPSVVRPAGKMFTAQGPKDMPEPRALSLGEIEQTIRDFRHAAAQAIAAGADGVELHGANGYLIQQFLSENANRRADAYGGSIENRIRFAVEVAAAVADEIGASRTAIRISPGGTFNDIVEGETQALYQALIPELARQGLAYLHIVQAGTQAGTQAGDDALLRWARPRWPTALIVNRPGRPRDRIAMDIDAGLADVASVAALALANPDLVARLRAGAPLNDPDRATFYGGGEHGYTDYPVLAASAAHGG
ncbi:MAG TPA: alkene reductase [Kofleriaceae bacterium]